MVDVTDPDPIAAQVAERLGGWVGHERHAVRLAVHEVVANALEHGRTPVDVRVETCPDETVVTVADHGSGPTRPAPDAVAPGAADAERGRGLLLARAGCDELTAGTDVRGRHEVRLCYRPVTRRAQP